MRWRQCTFQLTRPVWGEPRLWSRRISRQYDFNSLAPCGANHSAAICLCSKRNFNSLAPCGANRTLSVSYSCSTSFQLTRPVWGEPANLLRQRLQQMISTHSPRVGRTTFTRFNSSVASIFQLTRPVWGEPLQGAQVHFDRQFQLTRPVWGEPQSLAKHRLRQQISTHSPRVGRTFTYL